MLTTFNRLFWALVSVRFANQLDSSVVTGSVFPALDYARQLGIVDMIANVWQCVDLLLTWQSSPEVKVARFNGKDRIFMNDELHTEIRKLGHRGNYKYVLSGSGICTVYDSRDDAIAAALSILWD